MNDHVTLEMARTTIVALASFLRASQPTLTALEITLDVSAPLAVQLEQSWSALLLRTCKLEEEQRGAAEAREDLASLKQRLKRAQGVADEPARLLDNVAYDLNASGIFLGFASAVVVRPEDDPGLDEARLCLIHPDAHHSTPVAEDGATLQAQLEVVREWIDEEARGQLDRHAASTRSLQAEVARLQNMLTASRALADELQRQNEGLAKSHKQSIERGDALGESARSFRVELERQQADNEALQGRLSTSRALVEGGQREVDRLREDNRALLAALDDAERRERENVSSLRAVLAKQGEEVAALRAQAQRDQKMIERDVELIEEANRDSDAASTTIDALHAELAEERRQCETLGADLQRALRQIEQDARRADAKNAEAVEAVAALQALLEKELKRSKSLEAQVDRLKFERTFSDVQRAKMRAALGESPRQQQPAEEEQQPAEEEQQPAEEEQQPDAAAAAVSEALARTSVAALIETLGAVEDLHHAQVARLAQHSGDVRWRAMGFGPLVELAETSARRAYAVMRHEGDLNAGEAKRRLADAANYLALAATRLK